MGDSREARAFAISVREEASVHPEEGRGYERELTRLWGGPPPRWYPAALSSFPRASGVALVTGGASGIGFFAAKLLAAVGMVVLIPARPHLPHEAAGAVAAIRASLPNADVRVPSVPLDLGSLASVREFCAHLRAEEGQLDVLGLNAGRGGSENNALELSEDGFEATMQVNFLSHALMVRELLPLLRRSDFARVVAHTSSARHNSRASELGELSNTRRGTSPWSQYSLSKAALCMFSKALNSRLGEMGVTGAASVADPGLAATGLNIQHDLVRMLGLSRRGISDTKDFHEKAAVHAADASLPFALAALEGQPNGLYVGDGPSATTLNAAAHRAGHLLWPDVRRGDPMLWSDSDAEVLWASTWALLEKHSNASWRPPPKDEL